MNNVHHRTPAASPARVPHVLDNVPDLRSAPNRSSSASPIRASRSVSPKRAITALKDRGCIYLLHPGPGVSEDARVRELRVRLAKLKEFIPTEWQERLEAGDPSGIDDIDDTAAFGQQGVYTEDDWESIRRICSDAALCADLHKDENAWTLVVQEVFRLALRTAPLGDRCFELNNMYVCHAGHCATSITLTTRKLIDLPNRSHLNIYHERNSPLLHQHTSNRFKRKPTWLSPFIPGKTKLCAPSQPQYPVVTIAYPSVT